ncbi:hypothetical protein [Acrocarpospora sp. B8E8]|uniref:imine reductase family protein n=1 Tax=Acrocarpospora sp. B8E8 TaxID=3153572 RepID=UPI00325EF76C
MPSGLETDARAMAHLVEESEAVGVNAELPKLIKAMADRSIAAGHGGELALTREHHRGSRT